MKCASISSMCAAMFRKCQKQQPEPTVQIDIPPWQDNPIVLDADQDEAIGNAAKVAQQAADFATHAVSIAEKRVLHMKRAASVDVQTNEWEVVGDIVDEDRPGSV